MTTTFDPAAQRARQQWDWARGPQGNNAVGIWRS
jgi:hypothetical protein